MPKEWWDLITVKINQILFILDFSKLNLNSFVERNNSKVENIKNVITINNLASFDNLSGRDETKSEIPVTQKDIVFAYSNAKGVKMYLFLFC